MEDATDITDGPDSDYFPSLINAVIEWVTCSFRNSLIWSVDPYEMGQLSLTVVLAPRLWSSLTIEAQDVATYLRIEP